MDRIESFLQLAVEQGASDVHLVAGQPPRLRIGGQITRVKFRDLTEDDILRFLEDALSEDARRTYTEKLAVDFAHRCGESRFRGNAYRHLGGVGLAMRLIPDRIPALDEIGLPESVKLAISQPRGLTLVTGPTGSGKSTTLAAMVRHINDTRRDHIVTLEDPIEFMHTPRKSVITQREIGLHAPSFAEGLRDAVREDPDVIMVGELRDRETIALALTAAETGVQVMGTLHTLGAGRTVERIVNAFPSRRQDQVRTMLADSLVLVVSQQLVRTEGNNRKAAAEVLLNNQAAASMIRSGNGHKLTTVIQTGGALGMQSLDAVLKSMVLAGEITATEAYEHAIDRSIFERMTVREEAA